MSNKIKCSCINCNTIFYKYPSDLKNGRGKYCSRICRRKHKNVIHNCLHCSKEIIVKKSVQYTEGKYCNKTCVKAAKTSTFTCRNCDTKFTSPNSNKPTYCSRLCANQYSGFYSRDYFKKNPDIALSPAYLYLIEFEEHGRKFQKIGITRKTLQKRWSPYKFNYNIISLEKDTLYNSYKKEQAFKKKNKPYKYIPQTLPNGTTECFILPNPRP